MALLSDGNRYVHGRESYRYVEKLIRSGNEVCIVSPYIDPYYAAFIRKNAHARRFYVVSSSLDRGAARILTSRSSPIGVVLFATLVLCIDYAVSVLGFLSAAILLLSASVIFLRFAVFKVFGRNMISLRMPKNFVHAKIYVSDRMAINGSANLTYRGMHSNIEHIEITTEKAAVEKLRREFWDLWGSV
jgi:phosphatidylserine/phosphatidylglycerophosphate/cardiolipin synthase-like enzyme